MQEKPTAEELVKLRTQRDLFYDEHLPFLRKQAEYDRLNAEVVESKLREKLAKLKLASLVAEELKEKSGEKEEVKDGNKG